MAEGSGKAVVPAELGDLRDFGAENVNLGKSPYSAVKYVAQLRLISKA